MLDAKNMVNNTENGIFHFTSLKLLLVMLEKQIRGEIFHITNKVFCQNSGIF